MANTVKITWYKHAVIENEPMTLEAAMRLAITALPHASQRLLTEAGDVKVGINSWRDQNGLLFGQFLTFVPGMKHSLIALDNTKPSFDVSAIAAQQTGSVKNEFLDSIAYFGVLDNHVILAQTRALDSRDFENYLNWITKAATTTIPATDDVVLEDPAATTARKKHARSNIRGLTIGAPVRARPEDDAVAANETGSINTTVSTGTYILAGPGADVLRSILPDGVLRQAFAKEFT